MDYRNTYPFGRAHAQPAAAFISWRQLSRRDAQRCPQRRVGARNSVSPKTSNRSFLVSVKRACATYTVCECVCLRVCCVRGKRAENSCPSWKSPPNAAFVHYKVIKVQKRIDSWYCAANVWTLYESAEAIAATIARQLKRQLLIVECTTRRHITPSNVLAST